MHIDASNESDLLAQFQSSDPNSAVAELFETYADPIYRLAMQLLGDPTAAEDVVQETFLSAMTHRAGFQGRSKLSSWLYRIAYNAALNRLRRNREDPMPEEDPDEDTPAPLPRSLIEWTMTPEDINANKEAGDYLEKAIMALPMKYRVVFFLRDIEDQSTEQTAGVLGLTETAVKVRLHRARLALRESLSEYFTERNAKV
ncbi:MAG: sigma-70 family RNA polymerase sigma factor [Leptolinea sp.]